MLSMITRRSIRWLVLSPCSAIRLYIRLITRIHPGLGNQLANRWSELVDKQVVGVIHQADSREVHLRFSAPNPVCRYRADTFSTKEPETLNWIEEFGGPTSSDSPVLFDIGANIGLYSIYHCLLNNASAVAFEPSFFNLRQLAYNIRLNGCQEAMTVISNPLSDSTGPSPFRFGSTEEGSALSAFGVDYGHDGTNIESQLAITVPGMSLDSMYTCGLVTVKPTFAKIDVDGIEHLILRGAARTFSDPSCRSILIEVNDSFDRQAELVPLLLRSFGYTLREKQQSSQTEVSASFSTTFNQIWVRIDRP
jgi:FkbM family methyltransferase